MTYLAKLERRRFGSMDDAATWQRTLQMFIAFFGDCRTVREDDLQFGQSCEMGQPRVGHLRIGNKQFFQRCQPLELRQPRVRYSRAAEIQHFEVCQVAQMFGVQVRDIRTTEHEKLQFREAC